MAPIRRSSRARKPRDYWDPTNSPPHRRQPPAFTIYTEPPEDLGPELSDEDLGSELSDEDLGLELSDEDLGSELSNEDPGSELSDEDLGPELSDEDLDSELSHEDLGPELSDEDLSPELDEDLSKLLSRQLHEGLDVDPSHSSYQPQFLPKDRAGKSQNLSEDPDPLKLFQLFFPVKEIENIVKQTNQQAAYIAFKRSWKPLTVTETYCYLGCLVYMGVQPLRELSDHWYHLKSPVASCFTERRFKQIQRAFTIQDANTSPEQPGDSWWFRVEPLATTIREACQKYWVPGAHLAVDEGMIPYLGHTRHAIKAPHKPIKQGYKIWALADLDYIFNWLWYSKAQGTEGLGSKSRQNTMADTQALVVSLAKSLPNPAQGYILYLDNLFTNGPLAKTLGQLDIGVMRTTRVKALELPLTIRQLKQAKEPLKWGYLKTVTVDNILYFLWQDNNRVMSITTAYNLTDTV